MNDITSSSKVPVHVSIIMDGNGRWARERGQERVMGHFEGVESVRACTEAAAEAGVKYLSVYAFSEENWNRPDTEVSTLMELMAKCIENEIDTFMKNGVRMVVLGNRARLGAALNAAIDGCMEMTAGNSVMTLVIFLSYSGRWDILQAAQKLALEIADHPERCESLGTMDTEEFGNYLVTAGIPDPDLIIRTSGAQVEQLSALAERIFRVLLYRYSLAGFPQAPVPRGSRGFCPQGAQIRKSEIIVYICRLKP